MVKQVIAVSIIAIISLRVAQATDSGFAKVYQDSIDNQAMEDMRWIKHLRSYRLFTDKRCKAFLELIPDASLSVRKRWYRQVVYNIMPNMRTSWEYRSVGKLAFFEYFDNDYSHFKPYLSKLSVGERQRFFKFYCHFKSYKYGFNIVPDDVMRLKQDDPSLYLLARAQFNLLRSGRPLVKRRTYY